MKEIIKLSLILSLSVLFALSSNAQCKSFTKRKCVPELVPYKFNESFNAATLAPGEEAEVNLTFYSGQEYRIVVCSQPIIGDVNWKVVDGSNNIVFESFADEPQNSFDLKVMDTQQLKVHVWVPDQKTANELVHTGCVAILVGFKEP